MARLLARKGGSSRGLQYNNYTTLQNASKRAESYIPEMLITERRLAILLEKQLGIPGAHRRRSYVISTVYRLV